MSDIQQPPADNGSDRQPSPLVPPHPPHAGTPTIIPPVDEARAPVAAKAAIAPAASVASEAVPLGESAAAAAAPATRKVFSDSDEEEDLPVPGTGQALPPPVIKMPPKGMSEEDLMTWLHGGDEALADTAAEEAPAAAVPASVDAPPAPAGDGAPSDGGAPPEPQFRRDVPPAPPPTMPPATPPSLPPQAVLPPAPVQMPSFAEVSAPRPFGQGVCPRCGGQTFGSGQLVTESSIDFKPAYYKPARFSLRRLRNALRPKRRLVPIEAQVCRTCGLIQFQVDVDRLEEVERRTGDRQTGSRA